MNMILVRHANVILPVKFDNVKIRKNENFYSLNFSISTGTKLSIFI